MLRTPKTTACLLKTSAGVNASKHMPMKPANLADYKDEAGECLTFCTSLNATSSCFRGCLDDCTNALGPPPCVGFALEPPCHTACQKLEPAFACLATVAQDSTHECHIKLNDATLPDKECKIR